MNISAERCSAAQTEDAAQAEDAALAGGRQPVATAQRRSCLLAKLVLHNGVDLARGLKNASTQNFHSRTVAKYFRAPNHETRFIFGPLAPATARNWAATSRSKKLSHSATDVLARRI